MKKCLLLCCILAVTSHLFAFTSQGRWRWRKDDGTETTATYLADTNTAPVISGYDNIRLRTELYNNNADTMNNGSTSLAYSSTGAGGPWILISDTVANHDFVLATSPFVADSTPTTQQLPARSGYTFQAGRVISSMAKYNYLLPPKKSTEFEFVIKPTATAQLSHTYFFETSVLGYDQPLPSLTTAAVLPVSIVNFTVSNQDNKAIIKWTTANETNNDHFDVLRSADGQSWQTIAIVKANNTPSNYSFTDNTPLNGTGYYRLSQTDKGGKASLSEIKTLVVQLKGLLASVYPNPVVGAINIQLKNYTGSVTATLINAQGTVVHKEVIAASSATSSYRMNLNTKLPAGTYFVTLSGTGLSQTIKVMVQ